jgi:hypothetical protein
MKTKYKMLAYMVGYRAFVFHTSWLKLHLSYLTLEFIRQRLLAVLVRGLRHEILGPETFNCYQSVDPKSDEYRSVKVT